MGVLLFKEFLQQDQPVFDFFSPGKIRLRCLWGIGLQPLLPGFNLIDEEAGKSMDNSKDARHVHHLIC